MAYACIFAFLLVSVQIDYFVSSSHPYNSESIHQIRLQSIAFLTLDNKEKVKEKMQTRWIDNKWKCTTSFTLIAFYECYYWIWQFAVEFVGFTVEFIALAIEFVFAIELGLTRLAASGNTKTKCRACSMMLLKYNSSKQLFIRDNSASLATLTIGASHWWWVWSLSLA